MHCRMLMKYYNFNSTIYMIVKCMRVGIKDFII